MPKFERGFKAWCEREAERQRDALGLTATSTLDPRDVAVALDVIVVTPDAIPGVAVDDLDQLLRRDTSSWSAVTLQGNGRNILIHNGSHAPVRQNSNIAHELAHLILRHDGSREVFSLELQWLIRSYDAQQEAEADWLGWALLLPRVALLDRRKAGATAEGIAREFGVSLQLTNYRLRMTGVERQVRGRR